MLDGFDSLDGIVDEIATTLSSISGEGYFSYKQK